MRVTHTRRGHAYSRIAKARSQSAMEYLMTYGWAILIIAIVVVALFSLGVFNPSNFAARAQPGLCEVLRSSAVVSLAGQCNGLLPEYVAQFNGGTVQLPQLPITIGSVTITAWVYFPPGTSSNYYDFIGFHNAAGYGFEDLMLPSGELGTRFDTLSYSNYYAYGSTLSPIGAWVFYAVVLYQSSYAIGYTDAQVGSGTPAYSSYYLTANQNYIGFPGANLHYGGDPPDGIMISNVQLYNTSLSQPEIQALYQEGIGRAPINVNNLVGWWPLNGNANDYSGNGNDGTPSNVTYTSSWTSGYSAP